jgi:hypothetical protein
LVGYVPLGNGALHVKKAVQAVSELQPRRRGPGDDHFILHHLLVHLVASRRNGQAHVVEKVAYQAAVLVIAVGPR